MEEFIAYLVKNLVSNPDAVQVTSSESEGMLHIQMRVADEDAGKVIGRGGKTINSLRTIARTVATRLGQKVHIELIQDKAPVEEAQAIEMEDTEEEPALT